MLDAVHQCPAFVFQWDITGAGIYLFVFLVVVILFGCLATAVTLTTGSFVMTVLYAGLLALVFALVSHTLRVFDTSFPCSPPFVSSGCYGGIFFSAPSCLASLSPVH
jgi:hypothetical protein